MADFIDFMQDALFDGGLRGRCLAKMKNPHVDDAELSDWFANAKNGSGYTVTAAECQRLRKINSDHELVHGPGKLLPQY